MFGTNHLGHLLLTAPLHPLGATPEHRGVTMGAVPPAGAERTSPTSRVPPHSRLRGSGQSKHATQSFDSSSTAGYAPARGSVVALVVHPGSAHRRPQSGAAGVIEPSARGRVLATSSPSSVVESDRAAWSAVARRLTGCRGRPYWELVAASAASPGAAGSRHAAARPAPRLIASEKPSSGSSRLRGYPSWVSSAVGRAGPPAGWPAAGPGRRPPNRPGRPPGQPSQTALGFLSGRK
jgi:hypothetical protein